MLKIFILGLMIGAVIGIGVMCLCILAKDKEDDQ